jgi:hypothetical protein
VRTVVVRDAVRWLHSRVEIRGHTWSLIILVGFLTEAPITLGGTTLHPYARRSGSI